MYSHIKYDCTFRILLFSLKTWAFSMPETLVIMQPDLHKICHIQTNQLFFLLLMPPFVPSVWQQFSLKSSSANILFVSGLCTHFCLLPGTLCPLFSLACSLRSQFKCHILKVEFPDHSVESRSLCYSFLQHLIFSICVKLNIY